MFGWRADNTFGKLDDLCIRCGLRKGMKKYGGLCRKCDDETERFSIIDLMKQGHG
jgi:hypothetical protein